jgi:translation initiation factor IF-2
MAKKRVHELAKELGLENKDLIAHLERLGITVKSHASTLEDSEVERVKEDLQATSPRQIVEERIKTTVIRRRAVRTPVEAAPAEEPLEEKEERSAAEKAAPSDTPKKETAPTAVEISEAKKAKEEPPAAPVAEGKPDVKKEEPSAEEIKPPAEPGLQTKPVQMTPLAALEKPKQPPVILPVRPPMMSRHKIIRPDEKKESPAKAPLKPGERIVTPPPEKIIKREFEKPKKKGKGPVEVFIEEEKEVPRRKVLEKKIEKKLKKADDDREVVFSKWREEKKAAPVRMKKTEITVPKAIKRRIRVGETITTGELAKRIGVKVGDVINKLMGMGVMATINQSIDFDIIMLVASEFSFRWKKRKWNLKTRC